MSTNVHLNFFNLKLKIHELLFIGNMAFIAISVIIFQHQTDELVNLIKTPDFSEHDKIKNPSKWNQHYEEHLKECIQLHQKLRR